MIDESLTTPPFFNLQDFFRILRDTISHGTIRKQHKRIYSICVRTGEGGEGGRAGRQAIHTWADIIHCLCITV